MDVQDRDVIEKEGTFPIRKQLLVWVGLLIPNQEPVVSMGWIVLLYLLSFSDYIVCQGTNERFQTERELGNSFRTIKLGFLAAKSRRKGIP